MNLLRIIISALVSFELLFTSVFSGIPLKCNMPEKKAGELTSYVNCYTGTGGIPWACAMLSPAATVPFGCVRVGPDTCASGGVASIKTNTSGYYYEHRHMLGFSLGRLSGTGARDYGMFRVTPSSSSNNSKPAHAFSHKNESAYPGYYSVFLPGADVICEMTASDHCAYERYSFKSDKPAVLYIDAKSILSSGSVSESDTAVNEENCSLTAYSVIHGTFSERYQGLKVYLYAEWEGRLSSYDNDSEGIKLVFDNSDRSPISLRMAVSFISSESAKNNMSSEIVGKSFDDVRDEAVNEWENRLSSVRIKADEETKRIFYTSLYHTMIMPTDFTDSDGEYFGFDGKTHSADGFTYRTDLSLWDTCRNVHSLYTLICPDIQRDSIYSLLEMREQGGKLARWPMGAGYSGSMFGNPAVIMLSESIIKNLDFDYEKAYDYMKSAAEGQNVSDDTERDIKLFNEKGYIPDDMTDRYSVSKTLEFAWQDSALANAAEKLGKEDDAEIYSKRAGYYKNIWNPEKKYFMPKDSGGSYGRIYPYITSFIDDIFGTKLIKAFCEGSARQWRWSAFHDTEGMINLFGSKEFFVSELETFMKDSSSERAALDPGSGFWIGNQHDIHTPYLFNDAGRPDLTQKWVRWTLQNRFSTDIDGLDGNDDGGTLSAWYVFSALGFYPVAGTDKYWTGSPLVESAELTLAGGKKLSVIVNNYTENSIYVDSVEINGKRIENNSFTHYDIVNGGEIVFTMK
ncbi:MAG: GH92 family glycosyl hydrolase [Clostridia bacterium]|nr:GH92 family glycosyl hydrolase [Clostridia bacterium]